MSNEHETTAVPETVAENLVATDEKDVGARIFIGNIGFRTTAEDVEKLLQGLSLTAKATSLPRRNKRPLGFAFVTMHSAEDASAAISKLDSTEFNGRKINVEIAKPPTSTPAGRVPREAAKAAAESSATTTNGVEGDSAAAGEGSATEKKQRRPRKPRTNKKAGGEESTGADDTGAESAAARSNGTARIDDAEANAAEGGEASTKAAARKPRQPRVRKGPPADGHESETGLFMSNLNRKTTEETLQELFKSYDVQSLRLSTFQGGALKGKSRGFGFIHFATREQQQKALEEVKHKEVDGRKISLKVLVEAPEKEKEADGVDAQPEDPATKVEPTE